MRFDLKPVLKGNNLHLAGWTSGYMLVQFKGNQQQWLYGPDIPEGELMKILRNPYPDRIFTTNIKNKFKCHKVGSKAS